MTATAYGWSGLKADGGRVILKGAPLAETALTGIVTYATQADFDAAVAADRASSLTFGQVQTATANALTRACAAAITGGFTSSALGTAHLYGSKTTDQANLEADMMAVSQTGGASLTVDLACSADAGATWAVVSHTNVQVGQVWSDFRAWRIACQAKRRTLQAQLAAATTVAVVQAIVWA